MLPIRPIWTRHADGFEVAAGTLKARSERTDSVLLREAVDLGDPVFLQFVDATDDARLVAFADRFGLPDGAAQAPLAELRDRASALRSDAAGILTTHTRTAAASDRLNRLLIGISIQPTIVYVGGEPRLVLQASTLASFMALEVASAFEVGAVTTRCERCNKMYLTGPLTGRRSHSVYCGDRCRVAANRARLTARGRSA